MKILILILSCRDPLYLQLEETIDSTWNANQYWNTKTYYYYGNSDSSYHDSRNIYLRSTEDLTSITARTIECLDYCLKHFDFDFILRTNSSSYINKKLLYKFVQKLPNKFYGGFIGYHHGIAFVSGSGMLISKNNIQYLVDNQININYELMDDVAIAEILNRNNTISHINRYTFDCSTLLPDASILDTVYHFRCKCKNNRDMDHKIMHRLHSAINRTTTV